MSESVEMLSKIRVGVIFEYLAFRLTIPELVP